MDCISLKAKSKDDLQSIGCENQECPVMYSRKKTAIWVERYVPSADTMSGA